MSKADLEGNTSAAARKQYRREKVEEADEYFITAIDPGFPDRAPLPLSLTTEGGPVWQPPIEIYYDDLINNYAKTRKAIMEFSGGDRAKTTEFLDWHIEGTLDYRYLAWACNMFAYFDECDDEDGAAFYCNLVRELAYDAKLSYDKGFERIAASVNIYDGPDGTGDYKVECYNPHAPMWGGDPRIIQKKAEYDTAQNAKMAEYKAKQEAAAREEAARRRREAARRRREAARSKRAAQRSGAAKRKRRPPSSRLPPRETIRSKEGEVHTQIEPRDRCVGQDDDEEMEEMEWLDSFELSTKQPLRLRPLILHMVDSCIMQQPRKSLANEESTEDDVD